MRISGAQEKYLKMVEDVIAEGPYQDNWESLASARLPEWFDEERLGIFLHWGIYSVPAFANEWYSRNMYVKDSPEYVHHRETYGPQSEFGYKDFLPMFRAEHFDASEWIRLFQEAGAGYIFPVAEHHDGFQMYASELSEWNAAEKGPCRDVLGELKAAAEEAGLHFCTSSHRAEHWFFMSPGREFDSDVRDPMQQGDFYWPSVPVEDIQNWIAKPYPTEEYLKDWLARTAELIDRYQPSLLYFDWWIQHEAFEPYLKKLAAFYYNMGHIWGKNVQICYKHDSMGFGCGIVDVERGGYSQPKPYRWQTDTAAARNSWCYTETLDYKSGREIIITLIDNVSKNGNLLLNIGPKADGTIAQRDQQILRELGAWMKVNSEAIRSAKPWRVSMEGPGNITEGAFQDGAETIYTSEDYRFTSKNGKVYAFCLSCPKDGNYTIHSLGEYGSGAPFQGMVRSVEALGYDGPLSWHTDRDGLHLSAPDLQSEFPVVFRITS